MPRSTTFSVNVAFGDCDPAGIVFFPNYSRWLDASSLSFFLQCGVPLWRELVKTTGIVGTPLLEHQIKFHKTATYGETIVVSTHVEEWRAKVFVQVHRVTREGELLCEGRDTRTFVRRDPDNPDRIRAIAVPEDIKALCS